MSSENNTSIETLLHKYFSGKTSTEENRQVEQWIALSDENEEMAAYLHQVYLAVDVADTIESIDGYKALKQVKAIINKKKKMLIYRQLQRVAAVLFIPLLLSIIYLSTKKDTVEIAELRATSGMVASLTLPDDTKVYLNSGSVLKYPTHFEGNTREVELDGEAYFVVEKDKNREFIVYTPQEVQIKVLGTEFNLEAYSDQPSLAVTLVSGAINMVYKAKGKEASISLKKNIKTVYNLQTQEVLEEDTFVKGLVSWKDGEIILRNTSLPDVLDILSKRFNVEFVLLNKSLESNHFTGVFKTQHLPKILEHIRISSNIHYRIVEQEAGQGAIEEKTIIELY